LRFWTTSDRVYPILGQDARHVPTPPPIHGKPSTRRAGRLTEIGEILFGSGSVRPLTLAHDALDEVVRQR
jgi:hypothetical protein